MDILKSIKAKLILQISLLVIISTFFVLIFVNVIMQEKPQFIPNSITIDASLTPSQQRAQIQEQIQQNISRERAENAARLVLASLLGILIQVIFTSAGIYILTKRELKPLEDLNKTMQDINEKLLFLQINTDNNTSEEILNLITNFNQMMGRLDKAFTAQKQFVENVSHEVKTPLTIIKSNLESIIFDKEISEDERESAINSSISSINFLNKLVEDLLLLSFIDKKEIKLEDINLKNLIESIINEYKDHANNRNITIELNDTTKIKHTIKANDILLKRAISNLIENAIKYSKTKSEIEIELSSANKDLQIKIKNKGDKIPEEFKDKIFERFFRIDKSRSRSTGGFGLGLAITKEIIETFKGEIKVDTVGDYNIFTIKLPIS